MALKVYNTLIRDKEEFKPMTGNRVYMFVCGPTTYDHSHLGHARTYVAFDVIARYLRYKGFDLFYLMNITDIDDNIIKRANELDISSKELADKFFKLFINDMEALNNTAVNVYAKATEHIPEIISQAETLIKNGFAYESNGKVYFKVQRLTDFGKLSGQDLEALQAGARVEIDEDKQNPEDFILWKAEKPAEPTWVSPWGPGRPGWHIEDTAITTKYFGDQYDIHGGAVDLIFPHHESEIAIAESATGKKPFVKYWFHTGFLNVKGEKMSKSLGNFFTIQDVLNKYDAQVIRFFLLYTHYRSPIDYTEGLLDEAETSFGRLKNSFNQLRTAIKSANDSKDNSDITKVGLEDEEFLNVIKEYRDQFLLAMDDDFNTREALARLFDISHAINKYITPGAFKGKLLLKVLNSVLEIFQELSGILGLFEVYQSSTDQESDLTEELVKLFIEIRNKERKEKNFELADLIRDRLKDIGIILEDTQEGTSWKKA